MCQHEDSPGSVGSETKKPLNSNFLSLVPDHPSCKEALDLAQASLPVSIFNHSCRVFLNARAFAKLDEESHNTNGTLSSVKGVTVPLHILFVACILHDIGASSKDEFASTPVRFEVTGANVAVDVLRRHGESEDRIREAWLAIALHSSPHVAEGAGGLVRAVRQGVIADFGMHPVPEKAIAYPDMLNDFPRLNIEKDLGDAVVQQALERREKAPMTSWPGDLLRAKEADPDWEGVNKAF